MGMGVQIFDGNGALTFDSADSLARIVAVINVTGGANGSQNVNLSMGRPFAIFQCNGGSFTSPPAIVVDQWGVTWTYAYNSGDPGTLFVGYY